ncbi:hypothetical protein F4806DRAFT_297350 [Annulohypoxylon nitens]|nr:hypothetical protein F4806DRAFT_297350 [Annulohypoxylon nitens]
MITLPTLPASVIILIFCIFVANRCLLAWRVFRLDSWTDCMLGRRNFHLIDGFRFSYVTLSMACPSQLVLGSILRFVMISCL